MWTLCQLSKGEKKGRGKMRKWEILSKVVTGKEAKHSGTKKRDS